MAPTAKHRGVARQQPELTLEKYIPSLDGVPDEVTLGRLQNVLETLLSERSHPMIIGLSRQLERLRTAEDVVRREIEARRLRAPAASSGRADTSTTTQLKRKRNDTNAEDGESTKRRSFVLDKESIAKAPTIPAEDDANADEEEQDTEDSANKNEDGYASNDDDDDAEETAKEPNEKTGSDSQIDSEVKVEEQEQDNDSSAEDNESATTDLEKTNDDHHQDPVKIAGNRKFVINPKSEFVPNQSLPFHTFGIFNEDNDDEDEEMYKRRLGVVSYPKEDLSTLTAGPVPLDDYTRAKPSNQVQFSTYATFLEPYFRSFTDEDIQFLQQPAVGSGVEAANLRGGKRLSPFAFPPLGPHYQQQWAVQDAELSGVEPSDNYKKMANARATALSQIYHARGGVHDLNDQTMESVTPNVSLGPFTERLVAAVMPEIHDVTTPSTPSGASAAPGDEEGADSFTPPEKAISAIPPAPSGAHLIDDFGHLEERIKGEFTYVGVLDMSLMRKFERSKSEFKLAVPHSRDEYADPSIIDVDWVNGSEDDEISRELRLLQRRLKEVSRRNTVYKERLLPVVQEQLAWQEYQSILQDLDKQVDQAYQKRLKQPKVSQPKQKKRKDSVGVDSPSDSQSPLNAVSTPDSAGLSKIPDQKPAIKALMDKRERWINKIGPLFRPAFEMMREYETPKFDGVDDDEAQEEDDEEEREE